jgi:hypothetical protein
MTNVQTMLALGAMVLLTLTSLRFNSSLLETTTAEMENKVYLTAFSLADDLIEEIKNKAFDEATKEFPVSLPYLTTPANFGMNPMLAGVRDDIDDYHGYSKLISAPHAEDYTVSCVVNYVQSGNQNLVSNVPTYYKRVVVTVSSPFLRQPVSLSFIFSLK